MSEYLTRPFNPIPWNAIPHDYTGDYNLGIYTVESTQRYTYGTRFLTWDGRVYKYYNAEAATTSYHAACRVNGASACSVYVNCAVASQIGDRSFSWTTQGASRSEDDLAGGYVFIYDKSSTNSHATRGIVGNDASGATYTIIHLDYPLEFAIETSTPDAVELFENPYSDLTTTDGLGYSPWMGIPTRNATAGQKGWLQTWGPVVNSGATGSVPAPDNGERTLMFADNGGLVTMKDSYATGYQIAGHHLVQGTAAYGPLIMLQISI